MIRNWYLVQNLSNSKINVVVVWYLLWLCLYIHIAYVYIKRLKQRKKGFCAFVSLRKRKKKNGKG